MGTDIFRVGIVGCGLIADKLDDVPRLAPGRIPLPWAHAPAYAMAPDTRIVAAADLNESVVRQFAQRWGVSAVYTDYREMLQRESLDVVSGRDEKPFVEWDIMGSRGRIRIGNNVLELLKTSGGGRPEMASFQFPQRYVAKSPRVAMIEEVAAYLRGERERIGNGADGRAAMEIAMAFYESHETGGWVKLPLADTSHFILGGSKSSTGRGRGSRATHDLQLATSNR